MAKTGSAKPKIAIACQDGGSQIAFTAGVLKGLVDQQVGRDFNVVSISGTSGGAMCPLGLWRGKTMPKSPTVLSVIACIVIAGPTLGATNSYDGTYSGERSPINGAPSSCAGQERVTVVITGSTLKFSSSEWRDLPIRFVPRPDGSFGGAFEDPRGSVVDVQGEATGTAIDANVFNYGSGCEHHLHLDKNR